MACGGLSPQGGLNAELESFSIADVWKTAAAGGGTDSGTGL